MYVQEIQEPWLLTPVGTACTRAEMAYSASHCRTRAIIERCFGVLKSRFRCLDKSGGTLLYSADKACQLFTACAVLHNFCIDRKITTIVDPAVMARDAAIQPSQAVQGPQAAGISVTDLRRRLIQQF